MNIHERVYRIKEECTSIKDSISEAYKTPETPTIVSLDNIQSELWSICSEFEKVGSDLNRASNEIKK